MGSTITRLTTGVLLGMLSAASLVSAQVDVVTDYAFLTLEKPAIQPGNPPVEFPAVYQKDQKMSAKARGVFWAAEFLAKVSIDVYQRYISSQQQDVCLFEPSCSHFSEQALGRYGVIHGCLMTADRLQRCNGLGIIYYKMDNRKGRSRLVAIDPIEDNYLLLKGE